MRAYNAWNTRVRDKRRGRTQQDIERSRSSLTPYIHSKITRNLSVSELVANWTQWINEPMHLTGL